MNKVSPFDSIATIYDDQFTNTRTGYLQRQLVYQQLERTLAQNKTKRILELNCGTGADAIWLAQKGYHVLATDISQDMIEVAQTKASQLPVEISARLTFKNLPIQQVDQLAEEQDFDLIFSNFGGLNCVSPKHLQSITTGFQELLSPKGRLVIVLMSRFCWWETLYFVAKFNWKKAWRRRSHEPINAPLAAGVTAKTWYYDPKEIGNLFSPGFERLKTIPIGFFLPPSYLDPAFKRLPKVLNVLWRLEKKVCNMETLARSSDHFLVELSGSLKL